MLVKVKNFKTGDTISSPSCNCKSWLEHWINNHYLKPYTRPSKVNCKCCNKIFDLVDLVGGHVIKVEDYDKCRNIVPLCKKCNSAYNDDEFIVFEEDLISANCSKCINN